MRVRLQGSLLVLLVVASVAADEDAELAAALARYYESGKGFDVPALVTRVGAADATEREAGVRAIRVVLDRTLADERGGTAKWQNTPFWGGGQVNPARQLRSEIAAELTKHSSPAIAPLLCWYLDSEPQPDVQRVALRALAGLDGAAAEAALVAVVTRPHATAPVLAEALTAIAKRRITLEEARVRELCRHPRASVRAAAADAARAAGIEVDKVDLAAALVTLTPLFDRVAAMAELPPPDAPFTALEVSVERDGDTRRFPVAGWLIEETAEHYATFTPHGRRWTFPKAQTKRLERTIEQEVVRVERLRAAGDPEHELSARGGLTGQFEGGVASEYELVLGLTLRRAGRAELAAKILLPALDTLWRDEDLVLVARDRFGAQLGYQMLVAFAGDRDYPRTLALARRLVEHFAGHALHDDAVRLARELPLRTDDYTPALGLPTPEAWEIQRAGMSREEQLEHLARRLRLVNVFQWGQPGGVSLNGYMYAEPSGMDEDASWSGGGGKTRVINPYSEIVELELRVSDIARLAPHLATRWSIPTVSFWRDFHPSRTLWSTDSLLLHLINGAAKHQLVTLDALGDDEARRKEIARLVRWSEENASATEVDLLVAAVRREREGAGRWHAVRDQVERLIALAAAQAAPELLLFLERATEPYDVERILVAVTALDAKLAAPAARARLDHASAAVRCRAVFCLLDAGDPADRASCLDRLRALVDPSPGHEPALEPAETVAAAKRLIASGTDESRAVVRALIERDPRAGTRVRVALAAHGDERDRAYAFAAICSEVQAAAPHALDSTVYCDVWNVLHTVDTAASTAALRRMAQLDVASDVSPVRTLVCRELLKRRDPTPYRSFLEALRTPGNQLFNTSYGEPVAVRFARELVELEKEDPAIQAIRQAAPDDSSRWVEPLRAWLVLRIEELEPGQK